MWAMYLSWKMKFGFFDCRGGAALKCASGLGALPKLGHFQMDGRQNSTQTSCRRARPFRARIPPKAKQEIIIHFFPQLIENQVNRNQKPAKDANEGRGCHGNPDII